MSIYQKQIESEKLNNDVEAWLAKNQITQLPMGFTKFPDGNIPKERAKVVAPESERNAKIEATNTEARQAREVTKRQQRAEAKQRKQEERKRRERELESAKQQRALEREKKAEQIKKERQKSVALKKAEKEAEKQDRQLRLQKQKTLLEGFKARARFGDTNKLAKQFGVVWNRINDAIIGRYALTWGRIHELEEIIKNFEYADGPALMAMDKKSFIRIHNMARKKDAVQRGERTFLAYCIKEEKETCFGIYNSGTTYCISCRSAKVKQYNNQKLSNNRMLANDARIRGEKRFYGECKKHGPVEYVVHAKVHRCTKCESDRAKKSYGPITEKWKRINRNLEAMKQAMERGETHFEGECEKHGMALHKRVMSHGAYGTKCVLCKREANRAYHKRKREQAQMIGEQAA